MVNFDIICFDCELERFAEVFGDCIETEDIQELSKEFHRIAPNIKIDGVNSCDSPDNAFNYLDSITQEELSRIAPRDELGARNYMLVRAYYRFVNDAYKWGDCEDLERWETELFESLNNSQQKNFKASKGLKGKALRKWLFACFVAHMLVNLGEGLTVQALATSRDIVGGE